LPQFGSEGRAEVIISIGLNHGRHLQAQLAIGSKWLLDRIVGADRGDGD